EVARGPRARAVVRRERRDMDAHEVDRRAAEAAPQPPHRARLEPRGLGLEGRNPPAPARRAEVEEKIEAVGAREPQGDEGARQARVGDVLPQPVRDDREDAVVLLPAVELLESEEPADLEVDDADVLEGLEPPRPRGVLERAGRQPRHVVENERLTAQLLDVFRRRTGGGRDEADRSGLFSGLHSVMSPCGRPPSPSSMSAWTFRRSSSAPNGLTR